MFAVEVRDHIMIAHSLPAEIFGPAQRLHGATFVIDVAFFCETLPPDNIVVDIGRALDALRAVLAPLNYANLDADPALAGQLTTTEFLARTIFERMAQARSDGRLGPHAGGVTRMRVTLSESHLARAWYEADLR
ncbi:gas vesicle protein GvpC [Lichenicoccus sp.]|uniref:gas vesicle protein GvpC n=1 Tax=Lichenicoccus sp. TaxID=2781899 RepID=UPI003D0FD356